MTGLVFAVALAVEVLHAWESGKRRAARQARRPKGRGLVREALRAAMRVAIPPARMAEGSAPQRMAVVSTVAEANRLQLYVPDVFGLGECGGLN